jgi:ferredoxin-thioredoxin reductase catalytic chain
MQVYKYCHCLLFVTEEGSPITQYLPEGHEGHAIYGEVNDPTPDQGRPLKGKWEEREKERKERPS